MCALFVTDGVLALHTELALLEHLRAFGCSRPRELQKNIFVIWAS